ncbi:FkbM family methyltransferase [Xanthomonas citri pv. mangiferaeindicae]|uniref:FkbM family methyltransferase n=1 Tax=Xanthomonas citri TaxID=346 RepID=UPI0002FDF631|nr:FkbM family methyltransferase [Xanthomonas citri]OOW62978.1 methyltransferase FkbM [Xanthomonas campestris pv. centellae]UDB87135.1 FkbM family methyltransferase [Xanthomonas citri pv. mangiferaeindicae]UDB89997.1 FkbM family methyltransferase [Xanthomonas citri pv. mangiferaeindicae]
MQTGIQFKLDIDPQAMEETFQVAAEGLTSDPMFGIPEDVRHLIAKFGDEVKVIVLGTQGFGSHLLNLKQERHCNVIASVDDFRYHSGALYYGTPIISTDKFIELAKSGDTIALNTCRYDGPKRFFDQVCRQRGIAHINFEQAVRAFGLQGRVDFRVDDWGREIVRNVPRFQRLANRFSDAYSAQTLFSVLNFHLTCDPEYYHEIERPYTTLYFRSGLLQFGSTEKMVDCGASIGESLAGLIGVTKGQFSRSWMIEPDRINIGTLTNVLRRYEGTSLASRISLHGCGVGEVRDRVPFNHEGGHGGFVKPSSEVFEPADIIDIFPIDDVIDDAPTFIKMDIEGSELSALKGAQGAISQCKPKMAISAYHRATDLLDLSDFALSLNPDYRIGLRHHTPDRWDTCLYFY